MLRPSTFSIVAYDPHEKAWGIAVASKFLAVGAVVPWAQAGAGAVATQSLANTSFGPSGLEKMKAGLSAEETLRSLLADDDQPEWRQVGLVDSKGGAATYTGGACMDWAGGVTGENFAVQGNILTGASVVEKMAVSFQTSSGNLPWRLYQALFAGDRAGGDRRGRQSAAVLVVKPQGGYGGFTDRWVDYRVDDHPDPVKRLGDLLKLHDLYFGKSPESEEVELRGEVLRRLQELMKQQNIYHGPSSGEYDLPTQKALETLIGKENFEDRTNLKSGRMDRPVLDYLFEHFGEN